MYSPDELRKIAKDEERWAQENPPGPERRSSFKTLSNIPVEGVYTPSHLRDQDYLKDIGLPGRYPYVRGIHPTGYRG